MSITQISTASTQQILTAQLQSQQAALATLTEQLSSNVQHTDLTDYSASDALNLMNLQNSATQRQAYLNVISTVQTRLTGYDNTMTDMESIVSQAQTLAAGSPDYNANTAAGIASLASNFLKSVGVDLNQQIGGRYIYGGSRYDTAPVVDPTTLGTPSATILTDGSSLPDYDTAYTASPTTLTTSGQTVTVGGTISLPENTSVTVNGKTYTYAVQASDTTTSIAAGLSALVAVDIPGTSSAGAVLTVGGTGTISATAANPSSTTAYATDSATIDSGYTVNYGVSSDNPAFQQLIAGLQFMQAAGNTTDTAAYASNMAQANTLLTSAMTALQGVHASVANNINTLTNETASQKSAIAAITNQVDDIQQVDVTQIATELNLLQTQLQASYSATGTIEKMSIVQYL